MYMNTNTYIYLYIYSFSIYVVLYILICILYIVYIIIPIITCGHMISIRMLYGIYVYCILSIVYAYFGCQ